MSSYFRRLTTYRNDYNQGKQPGYDRSDLQKHIDYSKPPPFDDPMWQRGRNESSEQYEARLREMSRHNEPDYYRTYEERKAHHGYNNPPPPMTERMHERERFEEHRPPPMDDPLWRRGRNESSEQYEDRMKGMSNRRSMEMERNHRGMGYEDGSQTSRDYKPSWLDRGNLTYRRFENHNDPKFERYRPTQKDYGDFDTVPKLQNMPQPYRGQFDKQLDAFQNRVREKNMELERAPHPVPPPHEDFKIQTGTIELPTKTESGVYMLLRAHMADLTEIEMSFQKHKSILTQSGHLTGIATADHIKVTGFRGEWGHPKDGKENYFLAILWFPSERAAETWLTRDQDFKRSDFPSTFNNPDVKIVPINYIPPHDDEYRTFVLTEYPGIKNPDYFRNEYVEPMKDILKDYNCEPFVVRSKDVKTLHRVTLLPSPDTITVHRFPNVREAMEFTEGDRRVKMLRGKLNGVTKEGRYTTILFTINKTI